MTELATFAAGCFWNVEVPFRQIEGVTATQVGYTGGHAENPTYAQVCTDSTGHAEAVEVTFDPTKVSYDVLLKAFWEVHDPTQYYRQGPDVGSQYRSAIFYHSQAQKAAAEASMAEVAKHYDKPVVTEIVEATKFWPAEEEHQRYLEKRGLATCRVELRPA